MSSSFVAHPETRIGHVHLRVSDIERALHFYRDMLGFQETARYGNDAVFVSAGGYHHHIGLNTWESKGGSPPPPGHTGLYHVAVLFPSRGELGKVVKHLLDHGYPILGASDHGVSEAVYLEDPDGNGVELYRDRPEGEWPRDNKGNLSMTTKQLSLADLVASVDT